MATHGATCTTAAVVAFVADRAVKLWVDQSLAIGEQLDWLPGSLALTHVRNPGALLGWFGEAPAALRIVASLLVAGAVALVVWRMLRTLAPGERGIAIGLGCVLAGALGNACDRLVYEGAVLDCIRAQIPGLARPLDLNLADLFIVVGVASLLVDLLATERKQRRPIAR